MNTNLIENLELSISPEDFAFLILSQERTLLQLMHNTVARIISEVTYILNSDLGAYPDFSKCFELITELYGYGFKKESYALLDQTGNLIEEIYPELMPYFRLNAKQFDSYFIPDKWRFQKAALSIFEKADIYIEEHHDTNGIMYFTYCALGNQNMVDVIWYDVAVAVSDLIEFATRSGMSEGINDTSDHTGEHIQDIHSIPVQNLIEDHIERIIKAYVKSGEEMVIL